MQIALLALLIVLQLAVPAVLVAVLMWTTSKGRQELAPSALPKILRQRETKKRKPIARSEADEWRMEQDQHLNREE